MTEARNSTVEPVGTPLAGEAEFDDAATSNVLYRTLRPDAANRYPIVSRAEGVYLWDRAGNRYLDAIGGAMVVTIGHGVRSILEAIREQFDLVSFAYSGMFANEPAIRLAALLASRSPEGLNKVFFVSGGSEAVESAIKLARQYFVAAGKPSKWKFVGRWGSYHGNTLATLSVSGRPEWRRPFEPLLTPSQLIGPCSPSHCDHCRHQGRCTLRCADELEEAIRREGPDEVAGFIAEPVPAGPTTGSLPPPGYFERVREICDAYDVLFVADEIITGFGRLGTWFGADYWSVTPDMIACGKGIASGYAPLAALLVHDRVTETFARSGTTINHGFTFGGNPMSCAVALAVLRNLTDNGLITRSRELGDHLAECAQKLLDLDVVAEVRCGRGLFLGIELVDDRNGRRPFPRSAHFAQRVWQHAFERGAIVSLAHGGPRGEGGDCIIVAPPFVVTAEQIDELVDVLQGAITDAALETRV